MKRLFSPPDRELVLRLFGKRLRDLRTYRKWTQAQLSQKAGLDPTYLSGLERGTRNPSLFILARLAAALRFPLSVLLIDVQGDREPPPSDRPRGVE